MAPTSAPELTIHAIHLTGASLETTPPLYDAPAQMHLRLNLTPSIGSGPVTGRYRVSLRALAEAFRDANIKEGDKPAMVAEVTVSAFVELKNLTAQQSEVALNVDVPNQLVPVVRHHLQQLTLNAGVPAVVLPFLMFQANPTAAAVHAAKPSQLLQ
jgi:preprotein translocase subunit SecB